MIKVNSIEDIPELVKHIKHNDDGSIDCYFVDDSLVLEKNLRSAKNKAIETNYKQFKLEIKQLSVGKAEYKKLRDASMVEVGHKGQSVAETKLAFKDALLAYQSLEDNNDSKRQSIDNATTIEQLNLITWE